MKNTPVIELLTKLQWPDPQSKGIAVWQGRPQDNKLPPTINLTLTPKGLKAKVFNVMASEVPQPHLTAEFAFNGREGDVQLVEWEDVGGTEMTGSEHEKVNEAVRQISAFITLVGGSPKVDLMGKLFKEESKPAPGV